MDRSSQTSYLDATAAVRRRPVAGIAFAVGVSLFCAVAFALIYGASGYDWYFLSAVSALLIANVLAHHCGRRWVALVAPVLAFSAPYFGTFAGLLLYQVWHQGIPMSIITGHLGALFSIYVSDLNKSTYAWFVAAAILSAVLALRNVGGSGSTPRWLGGRARVPSQPPGGFDQPVQVFPQQQVPPFGAPRQLSRQPWSGLGAQDGAQDGDPTTRHRPAESDQSGEQHLPGPPPQ